MNRKVIISIVSLIVAVILFCIIWKIVENNEKYVQNTDTIKENNTLSLNEYGNIINISSEVTDECTAEWEEYNSEIQKKFEEVNSDLGENNTHYLLKNENGYIYVYYLDEKNVEYLYKRTTISVDYLSPEDVDDLDIGIEVVGSEELNKILEDFE